MPSDAFLNIRASLDSTTEVTGGDTRTGVGAVFIQKTIETMIREVRNNTVNFAPHVTRKSISQRAKIWNLHTSHGATSKSAVYSDGGTGTPQPSRFLELFASVITWRSDYEVTGLTIATSSSYWDALDYEAKSAAQSHFLTEEQMFILGDDASAETAGLTINGQIGVTSAFKGLKQLLSSAVAVSAGSSGGFADASTVYGSTRSSTSTDREYALNCRTVCTSATAPNPVSIQNLDDSITVSNIEGGEFSRRIFLVSPHRLNRISDLIAPQGRFEFGASAKELDGGTQVLRWKTVPFIASRLMTYVGVTSTNGSSVTFTDTDRAMFLLDMNEITFSNVAGVDARHIPVMGADASQRSDVEGGWFRTYGVFTVDKFNTQVVLWNLAAP